MGPADLARLASIGLRTRRLRASLSALGIAIGVAAIVAVLGLSSSSQAGLLAEINQLGTNLLTVSPGEGFGGQTVPISLDASGMIGRIGPVYDVAFTATIPNARTYRSRLIPEVETNALSVAATSLNLPGAIGTMVAQGRFLNAATATEPVCVLGAAAAQRLGIDRVFSGERIWVDGMWFYLRGILHPAILAPEIDSSVLIGFSAAARYLGYTSVYHRHRAVGNPPRSICAPRPTASRTSTRSSRPPRTPKTPARSRSASPPTRSSPKPTRKEPSTDFSSASAPSRS
jgi:putative ABC transport system permease protein